METPKGPSGRSGVNADYAFIRHDRENKLSPRLSVIADFRRVPHPLTILGLRMAAWDGIGGSILAAAAGIAAPKTAPRAAPIRVFPSKTAASA